MTAARFDCPVSWCTGALLDHGADGDDPAVWVHSDDGTELVHGAALYRSQEGTEAPVWALVVGGVTVGEGRDLGLLGAKLRDIAGAVDAMSEGSA